MRQILIIFFLALSAGLSGQIMPGIVGSAIGSATSPYGDEIITNGDFSDGSTGWGLSTGATVSGGVLVLNTANNYSSLVDRTTAVGIVLNHTYKIELDVTSRTSGSFKFGLGNTSNGVYSVEISATGHYSFELTQTNSSAPDDIVIFSWSSGANLSIDNISIMEVL